MDEKSLSHTSWNCKPKIQIRKESVLGERILRKYSRWNETKIRKYIQEQEFNDQMCDQLSFKEYEDPFKNVADFDDDDSPEVPADSMRK